MADSKTSSFLGLPAAIIGLPASVMLNVAVAALYVGTGYAGLKLAFVGEAVTLFWPPSGLAFAAFWLCGVRLAPGVAAGAALVNLIALGNPGLAILIALGNTLAPLSAVMVLRRVLARDGRPGELRRVLLFIGIAVLGTTTISATIGTLVVTGLGHIGTSFVGTWVIWWMGDAMGVLIVAPPILLWTRATQAPAGWREAMAVIGTVLAGLGILTGLLVFDAPIWIGELCKLLTLILGLWAAARFGLVGPAWVTLMMALGTVVVTLLGAGPFLRGDFYDSFALVHSYLFAEAVAGLLLAASLTDLRATVQRERSARADAEAGAAGRMRLLAMISHDLRTPLAGMVSILETLERRVPDQQALTALGLRAGRTLTALVADILDGSRIDSGRVVLRQAPFSPAQSLADVMALSRAAAAAKGLNLTLICDGSVPDLIMGDRVRFEQLVSNLVTNAVTYTHAGSVRIEAAQEAGQLRIAITDSGPGIDPSCVPRLFEAFALDRLRGPQDTGLGLGLHISERLTTLMGGTIQYCPAPGGGSAFSVELPVVEAIAPRSVSRGLDLTRRILLVEDDEIAGEATRSLLESHGHPTVWATTAAAALQAAAQSEFDVVLLDLQLGDGTSGIETGRCMRAWPGGAGWTIVALTADAGVATRDALRRSGLDGALTKPITMTGGLSAALTTAAWPAEAANSLRSDGSRS